MYILWSASTGILAKSIVTCKIVVTDIIATVISYKH